MSALNLVTDFGAVSGTDCTTAINNWSLACLAQDKPGYAPGGSFVSN